MTTSIMTDRAVDLKGGSIEHRALDLYPHRRQFVIGPKAFDPAIAESPPWQTYSIGANCWLSHCPTLPVQHCVDADGASWWLLGLAVSGWAEGDTPEKAIARTATSEVPDLYDHWAGRWLLMGQGHIHLDASGLLGCFYGSGDGRTHVWTSSSPALMASILRSKGQDAVDLRSLVYEQGISWFTPPRSRFANIKRLLPSQLLDVTTGEIAARPLMPSIDPSRSYDEGLEQLQASLVHTLKNLASLDQPLWLGLTAGYDSRLMLALSHHAGIDLNLFTRISPRTAVADRIIPTQLAQHCEYPHHIVRQTGYYPERRSLVKTHGAGHVSDGDAEPFIKGIRDSISGISFGGHGFAVASGFSSLRSLPAAMPLPEQAARHIAQVLREPDNSTAVAGLQEWLEWVQVNPQEHLDWRDRIFIEQRQAGWLSAKEQVYDLTPLQRFPILNSGHNYALLLSVPESQRLNSLLQEDLIRRVMPPLFDYPFNPPDWSFTPWEAIASLSTDAPSYLYRKLRSRMRR